MLPPLRFSREFGLVFLWICAFFWRLAGCLFLGLCWLKFACSLGLFFADFCIADCFFIKFHGHFALSIYSKTKFGRVFVYICSYWAFFGFASLFLHLTNLVVLWVFFIFLPNARWACFSVKLPILGLFFKFACLFLKNSLASLVHAQPLVVCRIWILESNPAGYLDFFGFGFDIVFLSTGYGLSKWNQIWPCKNLGMEQ